MSANGSIEPYQETRKSLEKLFDRMDGLELTFDRIVERSCKCKLIDHMHPSLTPMIWHQVLSSSMLSSSRRRSEWLKPHR